ncbi:hypothetical protein R3P38DRAFT_3289915 [Favolaschia claudopus]|uniref:Uncharacterized protein n=1 Tax=Favolaschia claudopus TaxID=2862362 RepID=A0AAV9ZTN3_9AGAR
MPKAPSGTRKNHESANFLVEVNKRDAEGKLVYDSKRNLVKEKVKMTGAHFDGKSQDLYCRQLPNIPSLNDKLFIIMSSTTVEVILSKSEEDIIRSLHKTLRATHYEDPSDQRKFLEECARVLLVFQNRPSSFAMSTELGEYVFLLRAEMHKNSLVLPSPASNYYSAVVDFAGKVARKRIEYFRNLKLAPIKPLPAIDAAKANGSQQEVPDAVAHTSKTSSTPVGDDAVSIPSDDEYEVVARPSTPVPELLSPLPELQSLMLSLRLNGVAPFSPSSPSPSLPDLVPIDSPTLQVLPPFRANDAVQVERGQIPRLPTPYPYQRPRRMPILAPMPVLALNAIDPTV